ncbi:hypothetical protein AMECASPLE_027844 [Ameca splendens]|uniref:Uncharacterized protein n=1 Tax=Ameca splendens TaxID=208324 RepID=A0ABV0Z373_9TELE
MSEAGNETLGLFCVPVPSPYAPGIGELALLLLAGEEVLPSKRNSALLKTGDILACFPGFSGMFFCPLSFRCWERVFTCLRAYATQRVCVDTEYEECLDSTLDIESRVATM